MTTVHPQPSDFRNATDERVMRRLRVLTIIASVTLALSVAIAGFCLVVVLKYYQAKHALEDFSRDLTTSFDTSTDSTVPDPGFDPGIDPDSGLPYCEVGQTFGCVDR
jgi:hypothetical protein